MGKVIDMPNTGALKENEIKELYEKYPDLKRLLGSEYKLRRDKMGGIYVTDGKDMELGLKLFLTIGSAYGL
jgi:hypothetical protein